MLASACLPTKWEDGPGICEGPYGGSQAAAFLETDAELGSSGCRNRKKGHFSATGRGPENTATNQLGDLCKRSYLSGPSIL